MNARDVNIFAFANQSVATWLLNSFSRRRGIRNCLLRQKFMLHGSELVIKLRDREKKSMDSAWFSDGPNTMLPRKANWKLGGEICLVIYLGDRP